MEHSGAGAEPVTSLKDAGEDVIPDFVHYGTYTDKLKSGRFHARLENGQITVQYHFPGITSLNVRVSDANGKVVLLFSNVHSGDVLDISSLGRGMYWLTLVDSSGKVFSTVPFVKL